MERTSLTAAGSRLLAALVLLVALAPVAAWAADSRDRLHIVTQNARFAFSVEIADTPDKRSKGLMFRQSMAEDAGMLFTFERDQVASFWMKNTEIPLDMLFISRDGRIADMHRNAQPHSLRSIRSKVPVFAVLEINGGLAARLGIRVGDRVEHPAFVTGD